MSDSEQVVIGLAGHIDHGKTALVQALTGVDTDTQAEEKRRGMTIDIGFAFLTEAITLVDVPGHDRFVKNMVRGVAGVHLGLLVVAADDGVMPQTREHVQILKFLGVPRLCTALSKIDLVEEAWLDLVEDDIRKLLAGTPYENSPIVRVSGETAAGLEMLRETLIQEASLVPSWEDRGFFRLPIDRVFSLKGFGTIVTGTVISGGMASGDPLELLPGRQPVKLRGFQSHGEKVSRVALGDRAALNVSNLSMAELRRGEQLATPGYVATPKALGVEISLLDDASPLPHNHPVRVNVGTAEVMARLKLPTTGRLQPGGRTGAVLELQAAVPAVVGDRFILRSFSPITTIGGGTVIDVELPPRWQARKKWVTKLAAMEGDRIGAIIESREARPFTLESLSRRCSMSEARIRDLLPPETLHSGRTGDPWLLTPSQAEALNSQIFSVLEAYHQANPYSRGANREFIRQKVDGDDRFLEQWLKDMVASGRLQVEGETWRLPTFSIDLSQSDEATLNRLVEVVKAQGFETEYVEALAAHLNTPVEQFQILCALAEDHGELVRVNQRILFHRQTIQKLVTAVERHFQQHRELTVADVKALTGTTRKYSVPLLEYLDRNGHTVRVGDKRVRPDG
ncbi:MAG: selenocysteine-specific translation elongation factor [Fidelibacterota bacterium]|nr:MAG: selenocysteine-specific translation elongation factor [Candidatus Neomarinimicrobiota bacterium]